MLSNAESQPHPASAMIRNYLAWRRVDDYWRCANGGENSTHIRRATERGGRLRYQTFRQESNRFLIAFGDCLLRRNGSGSRSFRNVSEFCIDRGRCACDDESLAQDIYRLWVALYST